MIVDENIDDQRTTGYNSTLASATMWPPAKLRNVIGNAQ